MKRDHRNFTNRRQPHMVMLAPRRVWLVSTRFHAFDTKYLNHPYLHSPLSILHSPFSPTHSSLFIPTHPLHIFLHSLFSIFFFFFNFLLFFSFPLECFIFLSSVSVSTIYSAKRVQRIFSKKNRLSCLSGLFHTS